MYLLPVPLQGVWRGFKAGEVFVGASILNDSWESIVDYARLHKAMMTDHRGEFFYLKYDFTPGEGGFNLYRATAFHLILSIVCACEL